MDLLAAQEAGQLELVQLPDAGGLVRDHRRLAETNRSSYAEIQAARPDQAKAQRLLDEYVENCKAEHCRPDADYLSALGLKTP